MTTPTNRIDRATFLRRALALGVAAAGVPPVGAAAAELATITDRDGHEMPYTWRPAADPPNARTIVWLHGAGGGETPAPVRSRDWNVLVPLDRFGPNGSGSWWLGEDGDFFTSGLLHRLVKVVRARIGSDQGLYLAGSSMGGYGAILHGMLLGAEAVYANAAQTRLRGTAYTDTPDSAISHVLGRHGSPYADLGSMVRAASPHDLPVFFLDFRRFDHEGQRYFAEHFVPFLAACAASGANVGGTVYPLPDHKIDRSFSAVLSLFDGYRGVIASW